MLSSKWIQNARRMLGVVSLIFMTKLGASDAFMGEIRWVSFGFAPAGWAECNGQMLPINQNQALFALLGTTYGGNGQTTFALPDLRGQTPIHISGSYALGQQTGAETHTLTINELPNHGHMVNVDPKEATNATPSSSVVLAKSSMGTSVYGSTANDAMAAATLTSAGGNQPHNNMKPYLVLKCIIALQGIFPSR